MKKKKKEKCCYLFTSGGRILQIPVFSAMGRIFQYMTWRPSILPWWAQKPYTWEGEQSRERPRLEDLHRCPPRGSSWANHTEVDANSNNAQQHTQRDDERTGKEFKWTSAIFVLLRKR
ncbi:Lysinespecific demethylase lidlike [Caligus rogercresseyi]|uniref:Lysinespecific demethylase lidlike n=1 Tax=Caligus rogercresseyi TaxID=217165 RepID=A0A7T8GS20_CALRO|nr:Lysinespecific demethylase lidlike [Caligus rogercresseyi]